MTTFLLIRHAAHDLLGQVLAGRAPDVHLNARGKAEAERLAERLAALPIRAVYTGPLERAQETAWPLASRLQLTTRLLPEFDEIDFGEWTAQPFSALAARPDWHEWNQSRGAAVPPGGESMHAAQERTASGLARLAQEHPEETVAIFSHSDVIRAALMHCLGMPLDFYFRFEVSPASVSAIQFFPGGVPQVLCLNRTEHF